MKKTVLFAILALVAFQSQSQTTQTISTGLSYQKQSFVNLSAGTEKQVSNSAWDIAFSVLGQGDAGVFVNESSGTSMGNPLPQVELYDAITDNFDEQPDPAFLENFRLFNTEKSWSYGAFNERRDTFDVNDYGWGVYDAQTGQIVGNEVYVVKLPNGNYYKIKIESLKDGLYTFKYANLDGSGLHTKTISKADHAGKTLAYFSFGTGNTVDVEPAGGFDLLYCRFTTLLNVPGTSDYVLYDVTGILNGKDVKVAEADGVDPETVAWADYQNQLHTELDVIGHDWKSFSGTAWSLDLDRVFFLKAANNHVWKLYFVSFEGSFTGKTTFEKTDLGLFSAVHDPAALGLEALVYPNPVQDELTVALDIPAQLAQNGQLQVVDVNGRIIASQSVALKEGFQVSQMPATTWAAGVHFLRLVLPGQEVNLGKIVKQ